MKIVTVIGARPQFIKAALVSKAIRKKHEEIIVHTGQHFDINMADIFFSQLKIPRPKYNLNIKSLPRAVMIRRMVQKLLPVMKREKPDLVIVYGDTNSTLGGALAAKKLSILVAHVEAGMRSYDKSMPEENNRVETDKITSLFLCSTKIACSNLKKEGFKKNIHNAGDVMLELLGHSINIAKKKSKILAKLRLKKKSYLLATIHRASNTDSKKNLTSIISAFLESKETIVFPIHPRTKKAMQKYNLMNKLKSSNVKCIAPLPYFDVLMLEKNARKIVTDSGGMQKESFVLKVPCITLRNSTEWVETVSDGWNILVGADKNKILNAITNFNPRKKQHLHYGNGHTSKKIARVISSFLLSLQSQ